MLPTWTEANHGRCRFSFRGLRYRVFFSIADNCWCARVRHRSRRDHETVLADGSREACRDACMTDTFVRMIQEL